MAAAVILPQDFSHPILNDSKQLTEKQRRQIYDELRADVRISIACASASVEEIGRLNILRATHVAMARAVAMLSPEPDFALIDGLPVPGFPIPSRGIVSGDATSFSIAAASVIAKVERDRLMIEYAAQWPEYGFDSHKGYGTKQHLEALAKHGPCPIHRATFQPIAQLTFDFGK
jgi:ribonuclease HII